MEKFETLERVRENFEKQLANYIGTRYAILCSSGRSAIRFSLLAIGVGHGDEVIIPDFACEILPITVFCTGATPKFVDVDRNTLAISPSEYKKTIGSKTKAVIFAHLYGLPIDPSPILEISQRMGIAFIDDAAQALGASIRGKKVGSFGNVGIISLNKFLNVRLGGAALTDNKELAEKIKSIREKYEATSIPASLGYGLMDLFRIKSEKIMTAVFLSDQYFYDLFNMLITKKHFGIINGWMKADSHVVSLWNSNALPSNLINQLMAMNKKYSHRRRLEKLEILTLQKEFRNLEKYLVKRRKIAKIYEENLKNVNFTKISPPKNSTPAYVKYPIIIDREDQYAKCINVLFRYGFKTEYLYRPLHESPFFGDMNKKGTFKESKYIATHLLPLPVDPHIDAKRIHNLIKTLNSYAC